MSKECADKPIVLEVAVVVCRQHAVFPLQVAGHLSCAWMAPKIWEQGFTGLARARSTGKFARYLNQTLPSAIDRCSLQPRHGEEDGLFRLRDVA